MSYARFGPGSDVYVYRSDKAMECCGCSLVKNGYRSTDLDDFIEHLVLHDRDGDRVPNYLVQNLISDWPKEWRKPVSDMDAMYDEIMGTTEHVEPSDPDVEDGSEFVVGNFDMLEEQQDLIEALTEQRETADRKVQSLTDSNAAYKKRCQHYENQLSYYEKMIDALLYGVRKY